MSPPPCPIPRRPTPRRSRRRRPPIGGRCSSRRVDARARSEQQGRCEHGDRVRPLTAHGFERLPPVRPDLIFERVVPPDAATTVREAEPKDDSNRLVLYSPSLFRMIGTRG